jgi:hypothetical protein
MNDVIRPHLLYLLDYGFSSPFWSGGGNKKNKPVYTTFYFAGIANFLLPFGREEGIKPSPAAAIVW